MYLFNFHYILEYFECLERILTLSVCVRFIMSPATNWLCSVARFLGQEGESGDELARFLGSYEKSIKQWAKGKDTYFESRAKLREKDKGPRKPRQRIWRFFRNAGLPPFYLPLKLSLPPCGHLRWSGWIDGAGFCWLILAICVEPSCTQHYISPLFKNHDPLS